MTLQNILRKLFTSLPFFCFLFRYKVCAFIDELRLKIKVSLKVFKPKIDFCNLSMGNVKTFLFKSIFGF